MFQLKNSKRQLSSSHGTVVKPWELQRRQNIALQARQQFLESLENRLLLTTWGPLFPFPTWNQSGSIGGSGVNYNAYCPIDPATDARSVTGCVPTAVAEICDYWQYPSSISFSSADAYVSSPGTSSAVNIDADASLRQFPTLTALNADLSSISYGNPVSEAQLVFGIGVKLQAWYTSSGTAAGVYSGNMLALGFQSADDSSSSWAYMEPLVITNIEAGKPVLATVPNHELVLDGYNSNTGQFHLELGWGGLDDGWYALPGAGDFPDSSIPETIESVVYDIIPPPAAATASKLAFTAQPINATAGSHISPAVAVTVLNSQGTPALSGNSVVTLTLNGGAFQDGIATATATTYNGVATFNDLIIDSAGTYTLTASDGTLTDATSNAFTISTAPASKLVFNRVHTATHAGNAMAPVTVMVQDNYGNIVATNASPVTITLNGGVFPDGGITASAVAVGGVATFSNLIIDIAGNYSFTASDGALADGNSGGFTIVSASASHLAFTQQPNGAAIGAAISPAVTVTVEDVFGNPVTADASTITLSIGSGSFVNGGTTAQSAVIDGIATFSNLAMAATGGYRLIATDGALSSAVSNSFTIVPPLPPVKLAFTGQPASTAVGIAISPAVSITIRDSSGATTKTYVSTVTLTLNGGVFADGGTTATALSVQGVATFSDLVIDSTGTYSLSAGDHSLTPSTSDNFSVYAGATIGGEVWNDANGNGVINLREGGMAGVKVTIQAKRGHKLVGLAKTITTNASGQYKFAGLPTGIYLVSEVLPKGYQPTTPSSGIYTLTVSASQILAGNNFGNQKT